MQKLTMTPRPDYLAHQIVSGHLINGRRISFIASVVPCVSYFLFLHKSRRRRGKYHGKKDNARRTEAASIFCRCSSCLCSFRVPRFIIPISDT